MNRREASKSETRKLILAAARKLFTKKGVEPSTMREIAKKAGVSAASVVVHFKNKTALLETALYEDIDHTLSQALSSLPSESGFLERLMHIPRAMFFFYDTNRELYRALVRNTVFEPEEDYPHLARQLNHHLEFLGRMIEHEQGVGNVRPDVPVPVAAASLASLYFGVLTRFFQDPQMTPQMALDMLAAMKAQFLEGILMDRGYEDRKEPRKSKKGRFSKSRR
ncbi:MAG: TetR/AcrR family transcriptional regulator [Thermodesulfobacteriota bacterium]|nr:TetR/AcrR family transcriptional regulator [Thermodesulfobacteriota bacterium]